MPVENERKFVLALDISPTVLVGWTRCDIRQAYLEDGPRIRDQNGATTFAYKRLVAASQELVEIETQISREDFDMLWSERATALDKTRYSKRDASGDWVVDFLRDDAGELYFVLAEVELPRGVPAPSYVAAEIAPFVLHAVAPSDSRFTNKRLTDVEYAAALYREIAGGVDALHA